MAFAIVRGVAGSFEQAVTAQPVVPPLSATRARAQHETYVDGLRWLGLEIVPVAADERHPDCCFVEDSAVVAGGRALLARSGAPSRRGEGMAVAPVLARFVEVHEMHEPATLDGGDCLRLGQRLYIGRSGRTNEAGIARAREVFGAVGVEVVAVPLAGTSILHFKCACSPLGEDRVLVAEGALPAKVFGDAAVVTVPREEAYAANVVARGSRALLSAGHPRTRRALEAAGFELREIDNGEFRRADGALTCLSIVIEKGAHA